MIPACRSANKMMESDASIRELGILGKL
jgi:hypothetical protein